MGPLKPQWRSIWKSGWIWAVLMLTQYYCLSPWPDAETASAIAKFGWTMTRISRFGPRGRISAGVGILTPARIGLAQVAEYIMWELSLLGPPRRFRAARSPFLLRGSVLVMSAYYWGGRRLVDMEPLASGRDRPARGRHGHPMAVASRIHHGAA